MRTSLVVFAFTGIAAAFPLFAQAPTPSPFQIETGHNTAACSNDDTPSYCIGGFPLGAGPWFGGWVDNRADIVTKVINPGVGDYGNAKGYFGNIAKGRGGTSDIHSLLYAGSTTKVFAVLQNWFSTSPLAPPQTLVDPPTPPAKGPGISQTVDVGENYAGQKLTGYSVNDWHYVDAMADDLWERGFDGVVAFTGTAYSCAKIPLSSGKYYGQPNGFGLCSATSGLTWVDDAFHKLQQSMLRHSPDQFQFALMFAGPFSVRVNCGCKNADCNYVNHDPSAHGASDYFQAQCIREQIRAELTYFATGCTSLPCSHNGAPPPYFKAGNYLTPTPNSPVVQLFFDSPRLLTQCTKDTPCTIDAKAATGSTCSSWTDCWTAIWQDARTYASSALGLTPYFVFKGGEPGSGSQADGSYIWTQPNKYTSPVSKESGPQKRKRIALQLDWGQATVDQHYSAWSQAPKPPGRQPLYFGAAWKGVDDRFWGHGGPMPSGLVTSQRCGQTWIDTFAEPGKYFNTGNQLGYLIVPTYDDHQAGTEFQTGIDNCASVSASVNGSTLTWQTTFSDMVNGSLATLDHFRLFDSPDRVNVAILADNIQPALTGSVDLAGLPVSSGSHNLYLKMVGKPGIFNKISAPMPAYTVSLTKNGPGSVTASSPSLNCDATCSTILALFGSGSQVTLTAQPSAGQQFAGWSGDCSGTNPVCTVTVTVARNLTATFQ